MQSTLARAVLTAIVIFLVFASVVVVLWVGAQDVIAGSMSAGTLGQFVLYAVFAAGGLGEIEPGLGRDLAGRRRRRAAVRILRDQAEITAPANPEPLPVPPRGDVAFDDVRFAYPARPEAFGARRRVASHVRPGEKVAIVGPSGAGKSTLFHLLLRFYDPLRARSRFDGVACARPIRTSCASASRWCRRTP